MLFLHTDSGVTAKEYKTRRTMFGKIFSLNKVLQTLHEQEGKSRFIALGDLNTMGRVKAPRVTPVTETEEIAQLVIAAGEANMQLLEKSAPKTWSSPDRIEKRQSRSCPREQGSGIQNSRNRRRTAGQSPGRRLGQQDGQRPAFVHREYFGPLDAVCRNRISERETECGAAKRRALFLEVFRKSPIDRLPGERRCDARGFSELTDRAALQTALPPGARAYACIHVTS